MEPITFTDIDDVEITMRLSYSELFLILKEGNDEVFIGVQSIDKLIEALNKIKEAVANG